MTRRIGDIGEEGARERSPVSGGAEEAVEYESGGVAGRGGGGSDFFVG